MSRSERRALGEYLRVKHGFAFKGQYFSDLATPYVLVTPRNFVIGGGFQDEKSKYYAGPVSDEYLLRPGDLVLTMTDLSRSGDSLGYPALIPTSASHSYLHNQRIGLVEILGDDQLDKSYLYYRLRADDYRHHVLATASGSTVRHTSPRRIYEFELDLPPIEEQRAIAHVLMALDGKIDHNRRTVRTLERLMQAIFHAWFVDFEPVQSKAAGATSFPTMPSDLFEVLPPRLTDSHIGLVPDGWEIGRLGDVATEQRKTVDPASVPGDTPYIGLEHMPRRSVAIAEWGRSESVSSSKTQFASGQILFGKLRPYFHKVGVAPTDGISSTDLVVVSSLEPDWFGFVLGHMSSDRFVAHASAYSTGTRMPRTTWRDMANYTVCIPPPRFASAFSDIAVSAAKLMRANIFERRALSRTRDFLMPRLLNEEALVEVNGPNQDGSL